MWCIASSGPSASAEMYVCSTVPCRQHLAVKLVGSSFAPDGEVMRVFKRQSVGRRFDHALGARDDLRWIIPLADVIEVLADLLHWEISRRVHHFRLNRHARVILQQVYDVHFTTYTPSSITAQDCTTQSQIAHFALEPFAQKTRLVLAHVV